MLTVESLAFCFEALNRKKYSLVNDRVFFLDVTNSLNLPLMSFKLRHLDIMIDHSLVIISICDEL